MATKNKFDRTRSVRIGLFTTMLALFGLVFVEIGWLGFKITAVRNEITATRNEMQASLQRTEDRIIDEIKK